MLFVCHEPLLIFVDVALATNWWLLNAKLDPPPAVAVKTSVFPTGGIAPVVLPASAPSAAAGIEFVAAEIETVMVLLILTPDPWMSWKIELNSEVYCVLT